MQVFDITSCPTVDKGRPSTLNNQVKQAESQISKAILIYVGMQMNRDWPKQS